MQIWKRFGKKLELNNNHLASVKAMTIQDVAIFGSSHATPDSSLVREAILVCQKLALAGYTVIDGGGPGVMRGATIGAKKGGGKVIGITLYPKDMMDFEGKDPENLFDIEIKTKNYVERTLTLMKKGQIYVVFKGGTGTISEFGMAWGLARLYFGHHKPLILYGKFWREIIKAFKENMMLRPEELKVFKIVDSPDGVLEAIVNFEKEIKAGEHEHLEACAEGSCKSDFSI